MADYNFRDGSKTIGGFFDHGAKSTPEKKKNRLPQLEPQTLTFWTSVQTSHFLDECAIYHAMPKLRDSCSRGESAATVA